VIKRAARGDERHTSAEEELMIRKVLAFSSLCLIVAACGNRSSLGSGDDNLGGGGKAGSAGVGGGSGGGWVPCAGKPCGAECSVCAPNDPACAETAVLKFCSSDGSCGSAYPECASQQCKDGSDCPAIGAPCEVCKDGSYACPSVDCVGGQCVFSGDSCQGQQCKDDSECPAIGAPCQLCPDGSTACPWSGCVNGECLTAFPGCAGWDPCAGKSCGEQCSQCPPDDPECVETAVLKVCDANGVCGGGAPDCSAGQCSSSLDCPTIAVCMPCADGSCAQPECVNGKCAMICPPPANPECKLPSDCPQIEICMQCKNGSCADIACINGKCDFACGL
jgi:hypothetical protein